MLLHVVHDDAVVSKKAGCRYKNCSNAPSVTGTRSDEIVQVEEVHDDSLRREYGDVCVSDEEGGDSGSSLR